MSFSILGGFLGVDFPPEILGPEMAAPTLWAPGKIAFFLQETAMPIKFLVVGGVLGFFLGGKLGDWFLYTSGAGRCCPFRQFRVLRAQDFYTPLPLNWKGQHLPAPEVYKKQSPRSADFIFMGARIFLFFSASQILGNASLFTKFLFTVFAPLTPPPSQPAKWWISSWISIKRTSNRIANTQPKLQTNPPKLSTPSKWTRRVWVANCCWAPLATAGKPLTVGTVSASDKVLTLQAPLISLNTSTAKKRLPGPRKGFWVTSGSLSPKTAVSIYTFSIGLCCYGEHRSRLDHKSRDTRRESTGGMEWLGVWNCLFGGGGAWSFKFLSLKFSENSLFLRKFRDFSGNFGLWKIFLGLWKMAIPYATNPYLH